MFSFAPRPLSIAFSALILLCSSVVAVPAINVESQSQLSSSSSTTTTSSTPSPASTLPFLYGKLADKFLRINNAYLGLKSFVLPDDALSGSPVSYQADHHRPHNYHHQHHAVQDRHHLQHEHDVSDSFYGSPVPPSEYQPPKRSFARPFVSWSTKAKVYSFNSCLSALKKVRRHVVKEE